MTRPESNTYDQPAARHRRRAHARLRADGAPSDALARGADLLLLEASGDHPNHSTAAQSCALAEAVGARVVLTHVVDELTGDDVAYEGLVVEV